MKKSNRVIFSLLVTICMVIGVIVPMSASAATNQTLPFTWSVSSTVDVSQYNPDGDWNVINDGSDLYMLYSDYDFSTSQPFHKRFKGTTMDNLIAQSDPVLYNFPTGAGSKYWFCGVNIGTDGKWYGLMHIEYDWIYYGSNLTHFRRIALATSTDKGATWYYQGVVISSDNNDNDVFSYTGTYYDNGPCDQKLFVDSAGGNYYLYYQHNWVNKNTGLRYQSMRVARSPISSNMAAGSWTKWYNGSWSQPGLGGRDSDVFMNCDSAVVFKSTYLNKFVALSRTSDEVNGGAACISTCTDLNSQNWTQNQMMTGVSLKWYNRPIDSTTWSEFTIGQNFRVYKSEHEHSARVYTNISFGSGSTTSSTYDYVYPTETVPDGNTGWGTGTITTTLISGKNYKIVNRWSNKAVDVANGATNDGATVIQYNYNGGTNQQWTLIDAGGGYFKIKNVNSGKFLDVANGSTQDSAPVIQYTDTNGYNQQWQFINADAGYFKIKNRNSGLLLDIYGASQDDNAITDQYHDNSGYNQLFSLLQLN